MVAVETVRDGQILDVSMFSDRLDVEYEEEGVRLDTQMSTLV